MVEGLRERKKRETRGALSRATVRLCVERGYDNVTVEQLAAAANVSERTFRNYFSGKAEAIAALHLQRSLGIAEELRARPAGEPLWEAVCAAVQTFFATGYAIDQFDEQGHRLQGEKVRAVLNEPAVSGEVLKADMIAQAELATVVAERTASTVDDVYPRLVASVIGVANGVALTHAQRAGAPELADVLRDVYDLITRGLPAP